MREQAHQKQPNTGPTQAHEISYAQRNCHMTFPISRKWAARLFRLRSLIYVARLARCNVLNSDPPLFVSRSLSAHIPPERFAIPHGRFLLERVTFMPFRAAARTHFGHQNVMNFSVPLLYCLFTTVARTYSPICVLRSPLLVGIP